MFFTKLFHGEYSFQYVDLFRRHSFRSPFTRCISEEFSAYIQIFLKKNSNFKEFETSETITFGNTPLSLNSNELINTTGLPFCFNAFIFEEYKVKVIGYQEYIQNTKLKSVYVFANEVFIAGEYSFTEVNKTDANSISKVLLKKYISESIENNDKFFIKDKDKNRIFFNDNGFEISVKYFLSKEANAKEIYSNLSKAIFKLDDQKIDTIESKLADMF